MLKKPLKLFRRLVLLINSSKVFFVRFVFIMAILFLVLFDVFDIYLFGFKQVYYLLFRLIVLFFTVTILSVMLSIFSKLAVSCEKNEQEFEETIGTYYNQSKEGQILNQIIIDHLPLGITLFQEDGICLILNKAVEKITDIPFEKLVQTNYTNEVVFRDNSIFENIKKTFSSNVPFQAEIQTSTALGKDVWISYHLVPLIKSKQKLMLMIMDEVSKNRYLQASVKRSEAKFHSIFDAASDGIYLFNSDGVLIELNKSAHNLLGYSKDEILKTPFTQLETPENAVTFHKRISKILSDGYAEYTVDLTRKDGSIVNFEVKASVIDLGEEKYILKVSRDITERKNIELQKQKELMHLQSLICLLQNYSNNEDDLIDAGMEEMKKITQSQYACIYEFDDNLQVFIKSSWSKESIGEYSIFDFLDNINIDTTGIWGEVIRKKQSINIDNFNEHIEGFHPSAHMYLKRFFAVPLFHKGVIAAIVGVGNKDSSYTKEDEEQLVLFMTSLGNKIEILRKSYDLIKLSNGLKETNANLEDFTYIASHDLREPLRSISNYSSFLLEDYNEKLDDEGKHMLNVLIRQSKRMELLIDSLLKYSKIIKSTPEITSIDLNVIINEVLEDLSYLIKSNNVDIKIERELPPVKGNYLFVREIYCNLVSNAIKYNNKDEKLITIGYLENSSEGGITLFVKDNGIGIPEKHFENVFKIFKRLHAREDYGGGTGAGLTIVKKMIEIHKGTIWIESVVNEGTTFYFTLGG